MVRNHGNRSISVHGEGRIYERVGDWKRFNSPKIKGKRFKSRPDMKFIILVINKLKIEEFYTGKMSQTFPLKKKFKYVHDIYGY